MTRIPRAALVAATSVALILPAAAVPAAGAAAGAQVPGPEAPRFRPGAPGVGDRYFPRDGNGGYDVHRYLLDVRYRPAANRLTGRATISAQATQNLSRFNLDLDGLRVHGVRVNGRHAGWSRRGGELRIDPAGPGLRRGQRFRVVIRYGGVPHPITDPSLGPMGFFNTDDGILVAGQPHGASSWFPVNDHPIDKAAYTFRVTVPRSRQVVANGVLLGRRVIGRLARWTWVANSPMASYLATVNIGRFDVDAYRRAGIRYWDAIDPDLLKPVARPRSGNGFVISGRSDAAYKRLVHTVHVPGDGGRLSFWLNRQTEPGWDFVFVEAHPVGSNKWTTLPDRNGHTRRGTGFSCPDWLELHPFLRHYQTMAGEGCTPSGTTGDWNARSGSSRGFEHWSVDLSRYAGQTIEVSITDATDSEVPMNGVFVDDIRVSTGEGTTSFDGPGDVLEGWTTPGAPAGSPGNTDDWKVGSAEDTPSPPGLVARRSFERQPEILRFLAGRFGRYPFRTSGGIVDDMRKIQFALETQTRPIYASAFFTDQTQGNSAVVHELAHQWYGDSVALRRWRHIWLNEGFATYAEWLWSKHDGGPGPAATFRNAYTNIPADDEFWELKIGNPGRDHLFDNPVYLRGAMTLQQLRVAVGTKPFFRILHTWARVRAGGHGTTAAFIRLSERLSGRQLDALFDRWLFTSGKPTVPGMAGGAHQRTRPRATQPILKEAFAARGHRPPDRR